MPVAAEMVRRQESVGVLFLCVGQRIIERPEGGEETVLLLRAERRKAGAGLEALKRVLLLPAVCAHFVERLAPFGRVLPQRVGHLVPLRLLRRRDLQLGLQEGDAALRVLRMLGAGPLCAGRGRVGGCGVGRLRGRLVERRRQRRAAADHGGESEGGEA